MNRYWRHCLLAALMVLPLLAASASAQNRAAPTAKTHLVVGTKVFTNHECGASAKVNPNDPRTWACTKLTVSWPLVAGQETKKVVYEFRAKKMLTGVHVCLSQITYKGRPKCLIEKKNFTVRPGKPIIMSPKQTVPMVPRTGTLRFDNYSTFSRAPAHGDTGITYWATRSSVACIVTAEGLPDDASCGAGK